MLAGTGCSQKLVEVREVEAVFVHAADGGEGGGKGGLPLAEDGEVHGQVAEGNAACDRIQHNPAVGPVERQGTQADPYRNPSHCGALSNPGLPDTVDKKCPDTAAAAWGQAGKEFDFLGRSLPAPAALPGKFGCRVSGERHLNRRKASPAN